MIINTNLKNFKKQHIKKNNQIIYHSEKFKNKFIIENLIDNFLKEIVDQTGGFSYAKKKIVEFNEQAIEAISPYPNSPYKQSMVDLIAFNMQRTG